MINNKCARIILHIMFVLYIIILFLLNFRVLGPYSVIHYIKYPKWSIVMSMSNLIPLKTMFVVLNKLSMDLINIKVVLNFFIGNIFSCIPLTLFLRVLYDAQLKTILLTTTGISLLFEIYQLFTKYGVFDIDAIILRCIGALICYILFDCVLCIFNKYIVNTSKNISKKY